MAPRLQIVRPRTGIEARLVWGSVYDLDDPHLHEDHLIDGVISLGFHLPSSITQRLQSQFPRLQTFVSLPMHDSPDQSLEEPFAWFTEQMQEMLIHRSMNVFVHCQMGWNRSAALLLLWLRTQVTGLIPSLIVLDWRLRRSPRVLSNEAFEDRVTADGAA